jgi:hypothetical protein
MGKIRKFRKMASRVPASQDGQPSLMETFSITWRQQDPDASPDAKAHSNFCSFSNSRRSVAIMIEESPGSQLRGLKSSICCPWGNTAARGKMVPFVASVDRQHPQPDTRAPLAEGIPWGRGSGRHYTSRVDATRW